MPFMAASLRSWVQEAPVVMAMNMLGFSAARVVISSLTVAAVGSNVTDLYSMSSLCSELAR